MSTLPQPEIQPIPIQSKHFYQYCATYVYDVFFLQTINQKLDWDPNKDNIRLTLHHYTLENVTSRAKTACDAPPLPKSEQRDPYSKLALETLVKFVWLHFVDILVS